MITNEKEFDHRLKKIGDLYEEAKDLINSALPSTDIEGQDYLCRSLNVIRELRDIAAISLKANHEVKDN